MSRRMRSRWVLACGGCGLFLMLAVHGDRNLARAGEPSPVSIPGTTVRPAIARIDGSSGPVKAPTPPPTLPGSKVPACALAAYAKLADEVAVLSARHAGDPAGFEGAYAATKNSLVGPAAMDAIGCKGGAP